VAAIILQSADPAGLERLEAAIRKENPLVGQALGILYSVYGDEFWTGWEGVAPRWAELRDWSREHIELTADQRLCAVSLPEEARVRLLSLSMESGYLFCRKHFVAWMSKNRRICYRDGRRPPVRNREQAFPVVAKEGGRFVLREFSANEVPERLRAAHAGYVAVLKGRRVWNLVHRWATARLRIPRFRSPLNQTTISSLWFLYRSSLLAPDLRSMLLGNGAVKDGRGDISAIALTSPFYLLLEDFFHGLEAAFREQERDPHYSAEYLAMVEAFMRRLFTAMLMHSGHAGHIKREIAQKLGRGLGPIGAEMLDGLLTVPVWEKGRQGIDKGSALEKFKKPIGQHRGSARKNDASDYNAQFEAHMVGTGLRGELKAMLSERMLETGDHLKSIALEKD